MKYYLIAGEASGDLHGSNLMKGLKERDPQAEFRFWGGEKMAAVGGHLVRHYKESAVMGVMEVVAKAGKLLANLKFCKADIEAYNPDALILIDYPGFNFRIAKYAHGKGFKVFYYIAPKVWAWKERRVERLRKYVDKLFIIFPFEQEYFRKKGIEAIYEGNPLIDSISQDADANCSREEFMRRNGIEGPVIALLAGSRAMEINYLMPRFIELEKLYRNKGFTFVLAAAPSTDINTYNRWIEESGSNIKVLFGQTYAALRHCSAAVINSGTASLEAAIIGAPQVVCYGMNILSYIIARIFVKIKYISLANIIMDKHIFKELIQFDCTAKKISEELDNLLFNSFAIDKMKRDYTELRQVLGGEGASGRVAGRMIENI